MDRTILPETYFTEGNPDEEGANTVTVAKKTRKCRGKKAQNRFKSAGTTSSASEASPAQARTTARIDEEHAKQVLQDLHLSSDGSDSEVQIHWVHPQSLIQNLVSHPWFWVTTSYWTTVRIGRYHLSRMSLLRIQMPLPRTHFLSQCTRLVFHPQLLQMAPL